MSGPKHSNYRLTAEQQKRLQEEQRRRLEEKKRELEERKMQALEGQIAEKQKKLRTFQQEIRTFTGQALTKGETQVGHTALFQSINRTQEQLVDLIEQFPRQVAPRTFETLQSHLQQQDILLTTLNTRFANLQKDVGMLEEELALQHVLQAEDDFLSQVKDTAQVTRKHVSLARKSSGGDAEQWSQVVQDFSQLLLPYIDHPYVSSKRELHRLLETVCEIASAKTFDDDTKRAQIEMRMKAFLTTRTRYEQEIQQKQHEYLEYENSVIRYQSCCEALGCEPRAELLEQKPPLESQLLARLRTEIEQLEAQLLRKREMEYIAQSVHEVMEALGYDLIATDFMQTAKRGIDHQIYEIADDQAVNVFTSDNGSVLFEVTGIQEEKREATSLEKLKIKEAMDEFCDQYEEIKQKLKERGITLVNEDLKPADEKYARSIDISGKKQVANRKRANVRRGVEQKRVQRQDR